MLNVVQLICSVQNGRMRGRGALTQAHAPLAFAVSQELRRELNLLRNFAVSFGLLSMLTGERLH